MRYKNLNSDGLGGFIFYDSGVRAHRLCPFVVNVASTLFFRFDSLLQNCVFRRYSAAAIITLVAGLPNQCGVRLFGQYTFPLAFSYHAGSSQVSGDGGPATLGRLGSTNIRGVSPDVEGGGFVFADFGGNLVRRVSASGILSTIAGVNLPFAGSPGTNGPGTSARMSRPWMVLGESSESIVILDK